jgi:hypothetical protein
MVQRNWGSIPETDPHPLLLPLIEVVGGGGGGDGSNFPNEDPKPRCFSGGMEPARRRPPLRGIDGS